MKDLTLGEYFHGDSLIHRLDPRTKMIGMILIAGATLYIQRWISVSVPVILIVIGIAVSGLPVRIFWGNLKTFRWLIVFTMAVHFFFGEGKILLTVPVLGWEITDGGIVQGLFFGMRIAILVSAAGLFTSTTQPIELADGIEKLLGRRRIFGLSSHEISMMMVLSLRFVPVFIGEAKRLKKCQMARGLSFTGPLPKKLRALVPLLVPLFVSSFRRADQLARAMESRAYDGGHGRTRFREPSFGRWDFIVLAVLPLMTALCVVIG